MQTELVKEFMAKEEEVPEDSVFKKVGKGAREAENKRQAPDSNNCKHPVAAGRL